MPTWAVASRLSNHRKCVLCIVFWSNIGVAYIQYMWKWLNFQIPMSYSAIRLGCRESPHVTFTNPKPPNLKQSVESSSGNISKYSTNIVERQFRFSNSGTRHHLLTLFTCSQKGFTMRPMCEKSIIIANRRMYGRRDSRILPSSGKWAVILKKNRDWESHLTQAPPW